MADPPYGTGSDPLTDLERARLRPGVRVAALERWLTATAGDARRTVVAHFALEVTPDDLRAAHGELGSTDEDLADLEQTLSEPLPPTGPLHVPDPDVTPGAVSFTAIPHQQLIIQIQPPEDPSLRAMWNAIEPSREP